MTDEVEVFLDAGDNEKDIVCPPTDTSKSKAAKRWGLLRTVTHAQNLFRRSLKKEEKDLLDSIAHGEGAIGEADHCDARKELSEFLNTNASSLPENEVEYLRKLIASANVSSEIVAKALSSLNGASLQSDESNYTIPEGAERPRPAPRQHDASFRKEVWSVSKQRMEESNDSKKEIEPDQKPQPQPKSPSNFFGLFAINSKDDNKEEKVEDDEPALEEDPTHYSILGTSADDEECHPHVLTPPIMDQIRKSVPYVVANDHFWLKYSMARDGASVRALVSKVRNSSRSIVAIETMEGDVFGAFVSSPWSPHGQNYFGSGEAFLWRLENSRYTPCQTPEEQFDLESDMKTFKWSGENRNVQRLEQQDSRLIIGGGGPEDGAPPADESECGCGLVISSTLENGYSNPCLTFKSPSLPPSGTDMFDIANIEVWTFTPVDSVDQAEKVELGRRFIFDNSNFVEQ